MFEDRIIENNENKILTILASTFVGHLKSSWNKI